MKKIAVFSTFLLISNVFAYKEVKDKKIIEKASSSLKPLKKNLMKTLKGQLKSGGPLKAMEACQLEAPQIRERVNNDMSSKGIIVGRTSHKLRNGKNAPKQWMKAFLSEYATGKRKGVTAVDLGNSYGYLEPIKIASPVCLKCHGSKEIPALVSEALKKKYPHDQATGLKLNQFRGLFWVEMKK